MNVMSYLRRIFGSGSARARTERIVPAAGQVDESLVVYGTRWCGDCHRSRRYLDQHQVPYLWIDVDGSDDAEKRILAINRGRRSVPTIVFPDGTSLTEPSNRQLGLKLGLG